MNPFDQNARFAAKSLDPPGFLRWLLPAAFDGWDFRGWLDTRTLPFPGEPDRTSDTVAEFRRTHGDAPALALVVEFQTRPRSEMLERLAEYVLRFRREVPFDVEPRTPYLVAGVLVNLTGPPQAPVWEMAPPDLGGLGLRFEAGVRTLSVETADTTLAGIADGRIARCVLPWVPLMSGAGEAAIVEEWKRLAVGEADERKRRDYAGLAMIFADLADREAVWESGLEGWEVERSRFLDRLIEKREQRLAVATRQAFLRKVLRARFGADLTPETIDLFCAQGDPAILERWFDLALTSPTAADFRAAALAPPPAP